MTSILFGAVSSQVVRNAIGTDKQFTLDKGMEDEQRGTISDLQSAPALYKKGVLAKPDMFLKMGLNIEQDFAVYLAGLNTGSAGPTHVMLVEQNGQFLNLDA